LFWKNEDYVWAKTGDTLFLRDGKGKLVLWEVIEYKKIFKNREQFCLWLKII